MGMQAASIIMCQGEWLGDMPGRLLVGVPRTVLTIGKSPTLGTLIGERKDISASAAGPMKVDLKTRPSRPALRRNGHGQVTIRLLCKFSSVRTGVTAFASCLD